MAYAAIPSVRRHMLRQIRMVCLNVLAIRRDTRQKNAHCSEFSVSRVRHSVPKIGVDRVWHDRVRDAGGLACPGQDTGSSNVEGFRMRRDWRRASLARLLLWCCPTGTGGFGIAAGICSANRTGAIAAGRFCAAGCGYSRICPIRCCPLW